MPTGERAKRRALLVAKALGLVLTFVAAVIAGAGLHADLAPGRRLAGRVVQRLLGGLLHGTVEVGPFEEIGLAGARVKDAVLVDEYGQRVAVLRGVRIDLPPLVIAHDLLFGAPPLTFIATHVRVEQAEVDFLADPRTSQPTLLRALTPRPSASAAATGPSTAPRVYLPSIELGVVALRARLEDVPPLSAELRNVQASLLAGGDGLAVDVKRFGIALRRTTGGGPEARGTGTFAVRAPGPLSVTFEGFLGEVETRARVLLNGGRVDALVEVPGASSAAMRGVLPAWPVQDRATLRLEASGEFPTLRVKGSARSRDTTLDVEGPVVVSHEPTALLSVAARRFDARVVSLTAPETLVDLDATVIAKTVDGRLVTEVDARTEPALVDGTLVPSLDASGSWDGTAASGTLRIAELGLPATATYVVNRDGSFEIDARAAEAELSRVPRLHGLGLGGRARGHLRVRGERAADGGKVRATYEVDVKGLTAPGATLAAGRLSGEATASLDALADARLTARVTGTRATLGTLQLGTLRVEAAGDRRALTVDGEALEEHGPEVHARGRVLLAGRPSLSNVKLSLRRDPVLVEGAVDHFDLDSGTLDVKDVRVTGAGGVLQGAVRVAEDLLELEAHGEDVDLDALSRAFGLPRGRLGGKMRVNTEIAAGHDVTRGRLRLGLTDGTLGDVGGVTVQVSADLDGRALTGSGSGSVAGIASFASTWDVTLGGPLLESDSYRNAAGSADVQVGNIRLPLVAALLPRDSPVARVSGAASVRAHLERQDAAQRLPNVFATFATQGLAVELRGGDGATAAARGAAQKGVRIAGIDATLTGTLDGATGESTGTTLLSDESGDLLTATGALHVDLKRLLQDPSRAASQLAETPLDMVVSVPPRPLDALPELLRVKGVAGTVGATASVRGTLARPTLYLKAQGTQLADADAAISRPIEVLSEAQYEWETRAASARATALLGGAQVATLSLRGTVPESGVADTVAEGRLDVSGLPIDLVGALSRNAIGGTAYGSLQFTKEPGHGAVAGALRILQASVDQSPLGEATLQLDATKPLASAVIQIAGQRGTLAAELTAPVSLAGALPTLEPTAPIHAKLAARDFSAAVLAPAVSGVLSRVSGRLDAQLSVEMTPEPVTTEGAAPEWTGGARGTATLVDGVAFIEPLGVEVRNLAFSLEANGRGAETDVAVRGVRGRVRSAVDNVTGDLDLHLRGLSLVSGTAELRASDMPVLFRGTPQGRATGRASATLKGEPDVMLVDVNVPELVLNLPATSTRAVIDLRAHPEVAVLQYERGTSAAEKPRIWRIVVDLGADVRLRRSDVDLAVSGSPVIELGGADTQIQGEVQLVPGGRIPILGRNFVVDQGRVEFDTGEASNPRVDVSAVWRAPNGAAVIVQVTGTLRDNEVALRSDPPLPEPEVFALLLGGSGSGSDNNYSNRDVYRSSNTSGAAAGSVALGGVSALGLNDLISNNPVELRIETTAENRARYTAAMRLRPNLWFEASTYTRTEIGANTAQGSATRSVYSGTVDYRFTDKWSLRTELGSIGGAMDLLWQYRY